MAKFLSWKTGQPTTAEDVLMMGSEADRIFLDHILERNRALLETVNGDEADQMMSRIEAAERMLESLEIMQGNALPAVAADGVCEGDPTIIFADTNLLVSRLPRGVFVSSRSGHTTEGFVYHRTENLVRVYNRETAKVVHEYLTAQVDRSCMDRRGLVGSNMFIDESTPDLDNLCVMASGYHQGWNDGGEESESNTSNPDGCVDLTGNDPDDPRDPGQIIPNSLG